MSKLIVPAYCGACQVGETRIARDATGAVELAACVLCGCRAYVVDGAWTAWEKDAVWRARHIAIRIFDALTHSIALANQSDQKAARVVVNGLLADWVGRQHLGPWQLWSSTDCRLIQEHGGKLVVQFAETLTVGDARLLLHRAVAQRSWFPRLAFFWRVLRDRLNARLANWLSPKDAA